MTEWFKKAAGARAARGIDEPRMLLIGDTVPDWVRLPAELGGMRVRVLEAYEGPCPRCDDVVPTLRLNAGTMEYRGGGKGAMDHIHVAECASDGFIWFRRAKP